MLTGLGVPGQLAIGSVMCARSVIGDDPCNGRSSGLDESHLLLAEPSLKC